MFMPSIFETSPGGSQLYNACITHLDTFWDIRWRIILHHVHNTTRTFSTLYKKIFRIYIFGMVKAPGAETRQFC